MINIALVAAGGAIGSVFRYLVGVLCMRLAGPNFPWGTLAVNVAGSFLIGLLVELVARRLNASMEMRLFLVTGVLGGFTTFSSFSLDAVSLFERGTLGLSAVYVLASLVVSIAAVFAGLALGRSLF
ncbi:fluoride efflux transporter CrcB [Agrobacterium salinitolerans]|uniref:Fluoride-specific ion channel FluC n=1 Tax=Agrobacterium salinitolerans TaxID=1183413 RepID=A0A4Z1QVW0_9HYPH|nr:fluoride efflux transporter CrcB [Agrobacterium salinitolerans]NTA37063.1 fluoride efflux transporter CrcB [Agrobacterium salinitolerans]QXC51796.1 fluoride efflux transporter CrcB [Agrobacterium salinitolerans]UYZ08489.1 fluoride efflux transporter CrcB [Agrobacterium salinitolerans]